MRRGWKIGIGALALVVVALAVNLLIVDNDSDGAAMTVPGGRILDLPDGDLQVLERGPRDGDPIVLLHCFSCAIDWWDGMLPRLEADHRVVAALQRLGVSEAEIVGHSLGGSVAVALAEAAPTLVDRVVIVDMPPDNSYGDLGFIAGLAFQPVIGEALWTIKPDFSVRDGLSVAFAPGFDVPDAFVDDVNRLTYTAYDESPTGVEDFLDEESLDRRMNAAGEPLMVLMGAEEQIVDDPRRALDQYASTVPGTETHLIAGAGHSPNVEQPAETAGLVLAFAKSPPRS